MHPKSLIIPSFTIFLIMIFACGLYDSPYSTFNRETDFEVDPEYINGILAASGIFFGIWAIIIERVPKEEHKKRVYKISIKGFWYPFAFFVVFVLLIPLTAMNFYSFHLTVIVGTISFIANTIFLTLALYLYKFSET